MKTLITVLFAFTSFVTVFAQSSAQSCTAAQEPLIGAFRVMNTAQMRYMGLNHRYATTSELLAFDETRKLAADKRYSQPASASVVLTPGNDPLPGYDLRLTVGPDGKSYVIMANKKVGECKLAGAMSDERGVIYRVEPLR